MFVNGPGDREVDPRSRHTQVLKTAHDTSLLNTQQYKVLSKVKWTNPGKGVAPSPTAQCSSYSKGSLLVALDYGYQLYFLLIYIYIYGYIYILQSCQSGVGNNSIRIVKFFKLRIYIFLVKSPM